MAAEIPGTPVHIEGASADASAGLDLSSSIFGSGSKVAAPGTNRIIGITDLTIVSAPGGAVTLKSITGAATLTLFGGTVAANGGVSRSFRFPAFGLRSGSLVLTAPAGQVNIQAEGVLVY